ncbi:hypothetical protein C497_19274 [Halalkalicoccus jeotgali B3]|uniref:Uncharacterized protein n=2 Tax=Halalkalicoccus jeotgali TaxID=413810 RepID=D8J3R5_HALJB|nr:hypothetical protein HacjB3_00065 [Halalkalicoccus jeotgali B3]ELY32762.1 hypothetical protein C497_19274 [Halalkalicoccus jeotgali B3]
MYAGLFALIAIGAWAAGSFGLISNQAGLRWISVLSGITVFLLVALSYLPVRG